jgi:F-type H+-transporting ATPase subunit gamma
MSHYKKLRTKVLEYNKLYNLTKSIKLMTLTKLKTNREIYINQNESLNNFSILLTSLKEATAFKSYLFVPITSDKSCCGSININLLEVTLQFINLIKKKIKIIGIFLIGKRGNSFSNKFLNEYYFKNVFNITKETSSLLTSLILIEKLTKKKYDIYIFFFNNFISPVKQEVSIFSIMSYNVLISSIIENINIYNSYQALLFSSLIDISDSFIKDFYFFLLSLVLLKALHQNELSELSGRITSMQNASNNSKDIMKKVSLEYNKARQSYITNELIEIMSALIASEA